MSAKTGLWAIAVAIAWAGIAVLAPERIGERGWSAVKIPVVFCLIVSWFGFVLAVRAQATAPKPAAALQTSEVDLSALIKRTAAEWGLPQAKAYRGGPRRRCGGGDRWSEHQGKRWLIIDRAGLSSRNWRF